MQKKEQELIPIDETIYVCEAHYYMPYHELDAIVAFIRNHEWEDIPDSIKDNLCKYEDFLTDNL